MNETAALMIFMAMTSTAANHQLARVGTYQADNLIRYSSTSEACREQSGAFDVADGTCYITMPGGRIIALSLLDKRIVVRIETVYGDKAMPDFTGVVVDQYRDELIVQEAILRDPQGDSRGQDGMSLPVIERTGREGCRLKLQFRGDGKIDVVPYARCDQRLAIAGAAKKN